ncbi:putative transcriptional regulator [Methanophagales archaeon]|nr:putative transcriptional regulator [Methanophagales archaeon]
MVSNAKQRSRWDILFDILKVISEEEEVKKTRIMQRANLDWRSFKRYFDFLVDHGFLRAGDEAGKRKSYELTKKGQNLLVELQEVTEMIQE